MNENIFGTDGIRAKFGTKIFLPESLHRLGYAIGAWALEKKINPSFLIGYDTRQSCPQVNNDLLKGLLHHQVNVFQGHELPTPIICSLTQRSPKFDFGIIITASHNTYEYNGIKICTKSQKISESDERAISHIFNSISDNDLLLKQRGFSYTYHDAVENYYMILQEQFPQNLAQGLKIVIDCAHGAYYAIAPLILEKFGAQVIPVNITPSGININEECGALHPDIAQKMVLDLHADIGFAFDGDGDRIVAIDAQGIIKDGDDILSILLNNPTYENEQEVVGTIMSNQSFEICIINQSKKFIRTPVGDKYISSYLCTNNLKLGGEPSGHIICNNFSFASDALYTALKIIETMKFKNNTQLATFTKFPQVSHNIQVKEKKDLSASPYKELIAFYQQAIVPGRLIIRYSGTEPILRITGECETQEKAEKIISQFLEELQLLL